MARNIEIKARAHQFDTLRERAAALATDAPLIFRQQDFFYDVPTGRLKLRQFDDGTPSELIFYQRDDRDGPKVSYYSRSPVTNPEAMHALLAQALTTRGIVTKERHVYLVGRTRIHLDRVDGLGDFIELEVLLGRTTTKPAAKRKRTRCSRGWASSQSDLVPVAYVDLLSRSGLGVRRSRRGAQRQRTVALECREHDVRAHAVDARHAHQFFHHERGQRVQIRRDDAQQIIRVADGRVTFEHFGQHVDLLLKLLDDRVAVMLQLEACERGDAQPELLRPQHDAITFDHPRRFEPLQPPSDLRRRKRHFLAELLMRCTSEALKNLEKREIEVIEFNHDDFLHLIADRAILMQSIADEPVRFLTDRRKVTRVLPTMTP